MTKSNLESSSITACPEGPTEIRRESLSTYAVVRLMTEFWILVAFSILAGHTLVYETKDSVEYSNFYGSIESGAIFGEYGYEPLYNISAAVAKLLFGLNYDSFASILVFVSLSIKFFLFSRGASSTTIKIAYLCTLYWIFEYLVLRQSVALSFCFLAFELRENKVRSWILMAMGCAMHYSTIALVPVLFFQRLFGANQNIKKIFIVQSVVLIIIIPLGLVQLQDYSRFFNYILKNDADYFNIWGVPRLVILFSICYYGYRNRNQLDINSCLILYVILLTTEVGAIIFRLSLVSIRVVDFGVLASFILVGRRPFSNTGVGRMLFWSLFIEQVFTRTLDGPAFVLMLLKS